MLSPNKMPSADYWASAFCNELFLLLDWCLFFMHVLFEFDYLFAYLVDAGNLVDVGVGFIAVLAGFDGVLRFKGAGVLGNGSFLFRTCSWVLSSWRIRFSSKALPPSGRSCPTFKSLSSTAAPTFSCLLSAPAFSCFRFSKTCCWLPRWF